MNIHVEKLKPINYIKTCISQIMICGVRHAPSLLTSKWALSMITMMSLKNWAREWKKKEKNGHPLSWCNTFENSVNVTYKIIAPC